MEITISKVHLLSDFSDSAIDDNSASTDVIVVLSNGLKYAASFLPYSKIESIHKQDLKSEDFLNGLYYWKHNLVLIENCNQDTVEKVVEHMMDEGDFREAFRKL